MVIGFYNFIQFPIESIYLLTHDEASKSNLLGATVIITLVCSLFLTNCKIEETPFNVLFLATSGVPQHSSTTSYLLKFLISDFTVDVILFNPYLANMEKMVSS